VVIAAGGWLVAHGRAVSPMRIAAQGEGILVTGGRSLRLGCCTSVTVRACLRWPTGRQTDDHLLETAACSKYKPP
jgi:hypothetical protein